MSVPVGDAAAIRVKRPIARRTGREFATISKNHTCFPRGVLDMCQVSIFFHGAVLEIQRSNFFSVGPTWLPHYVILFERSCSILVWPRLVVGSGSGSSPKSNQSVLVTHRTCSQNLIQIRPQLFQISCTQTNIQTYRKG